jgi:hypothetical protein
MSVVDLIELVSYGQRIPFAVMRRRSDPHNDASKRRARAPAPPIPTLGELRASSPWFWVHCKQYGCGHSAPMAFVSLIIRWGPDTSSNRLRQSARCTKCGSKGAMLTHPSYVDRIVGFQPFPTERDPA